MPRRSRGAILHASSTPWYFALLKISLAIHIADAPLPMTLGNMRANGVRAVIATCLNRERRHKADSSSTSSAMTLFVPDVGRRMRCSACGERKIESRPACHLAKRPGMGERQ